MEIAIHASFLPHNDPDASLARYRGILGFAVRNDIGHDGTGWISVDLADEPGTSIFWLPVRLQARQDASGRSDPRRQE